MNVQDSFLEKLSNWGISLSLNINLSFLILLFHLPRRLHRIEDFFQAFVFFQHFHVREAEFKGLDEELAGGLGLVLGSFDFCEKIPGVEAVVVLVEILPQQRLRLVILRQGDARLPEQLPVGNVKGAEGVEVLQGCREIPQIERVPGKARPNVVGRGGKLLQPPGKGDNLPRIAVGSLVGEEPLGVDFIACDVVAVEPAEELVDLVEMAEVTEHHE